MKNFKLTELEKKRALIFIENQLLTIQNTYAINSIRNIIQHNIIPDDCIQPESDICYILKWTPIGFICKAIYHKQYGLTKDLTDYEKLQMCYKTHPDMYVDKNTDKKYTFEELVNMCPFTFAFIDVPGLGTSIKIINNETHESQLITDFGKM